MDAPSLWRRAVDLAESRQLRALLGQAQVREVRADTAHIIAGATVAPMIEAKRTAVESLLGRAAGRAMRLKIVEETMAPQRGQPASTPAPQSPADEHPLVRRAAELFGAKIVHVEPLARPQ